MAYTHCPKAFLRSRLWDPASFVDPTELPTTGEVLREIQGADFDVEDYDQKRAERYARDGYY